MRASSLLPRLMLTCALLGLAVTRSQEVQQHGLVFEAWVHDTFFDGYQPPGYTQKWDIPSAANKHHGGIPVNAKAAKDHTPVDLGDALRQFDIAEPFILVIGYWRQDEAKKRFVNIIAPNRRHGANSGALSLVPTSSASTPSSKTATSSPPRRDDKPKPSKMHRRSPKRLSS